MKEEGICTETVYWIFILDGAAALRWRLVCGVTKMTALENSSVERVAINGIYRAFFGI